MPAEIEDFWPSDLDTGQIITPTAILRQQAAKLGRRTQNLLEGRVDTWAHAGDIHLRLSIVAPALDSYTYEVLHVHHGPLLYPVTIDNGPSYAEAGANLNDPFDEHVRRTLADAKELTEWLKSVLSSDQIRQVIVSLLAQVRQ